MTMTDTQYAYSTSDPETVAAYRRVRAELPEYGKRIKAACAELGGCNTVLVRRGVWGRPDEVVGLEPDGSGIIPEGWRLVRGGLEPRRGKPGEAARQWLADHQPPDLRHTMVAYGLPRHAAVPRQDALRFRLVSPELFELDGTLWARYEGVPGDKFVNEEDTCTWTPRKLSEFFAAREAFEAQAAATSKAVNA